MALAALVGCTEDVAPGTGGMKGSISPANSLKRVYLVSATDTLPVTFTSESSFELMDVKAGWYDLSGQPKPGFDAPKTQRIIITGGQTMVAPALKAENQSPDGKLTVTMNNVQYTASMQNSINPASSTITGSAQGYTFQLNLPPISGTDTFNTATNQNLKLIILKDKKAWQAFDTLGNTRLKITRFDAETGRADATFSFKAGRTGEKDLVGTNGTLQHLKVKQGK